jgi:hypothetical protein
MGKYALGAIPGVFAKECGIVWKKRSCASLWDGKTAKERMKSVAMEGLARLGGESHDAW